MHFLFTSLSRLPEISSQQDFSRAVSLRKHAGFLHSCIKIKINHAAIPSLTSNFSLCNKQDLNPGLSHLELICVPALSPPHSRRVSLKPERHPHYFHISSSDSAKPWDMCFSLTGLGDLSMYWSAVLSMMKWGSVLKCPPAVQPGAASLRFPTPKGVSL